MPPKRPPIDYEAQIGVPYLYGATAPPNAPPQVGTPSDMSAPPRRGVPIERFSPAFGTQLGMPFPVTRPALRIDLPIGNPRGAGAFGGASSPRRPVVSRPASGAVGQRLAGAAAGVPPPPPREQAPASGGATAAETGFVPNHPPIANTGPDVPLSVARGLVSPEEYARQQRQGSRR